MTRIGLLFAAVLFGAALLAGCESNPYYAKWQKAESGHYKAPPGVSASTSTAGTRIVGAEGKTPPDRTRRFHPEMYVGYSGAISN